MFIKLLARILPDYCPAELLFGIRLCKLNPWYDQVIEEKLRRLGYYDNQHK